MTKRISMCKVAEEHLAFIKEKREKGYSFASIAGILRGKGAFVNTVAVNRTYNNWRLENDKNNCER